MPRDADAPLPGAPDPWASSTVPAFRSRPPYLMTEMIAAEPALADRLVHRLVRDPAIDAVAAAVRDAVAAGQPILTTGCGTSEHAAAGIALLLDEALQLPTGRGVRAVQALELSRQPPADGFVLGISHEGGTAATNAALEAARASGARTALVTVGPGSPGAGLVETVVATEEQDRSWCHTVGYLSPLLAGVVLSARLSGKRPDARAIRSVIEAGDDHRAAATIASGLTGTDRLVVVGSGPDHVAAREMALKISEGARLPASALDVETLLHGSLAAATRWTGLVVIATDEGTRPAAVLERVARAVEAGGRIGMPVAGILGERAAAQIPVRATSGGRFPLSRAVRVSPVAGALLGTVVPLQLVTERLARARGVNPDTLGREDPGQAAAHA